MSRTDQCKARTEHRPETECMFTSAIVSWFTFKLDGVCDADGVGDGVVTGTDDHHVTLIAGTDCC